MENKHKHTSVSKTVPITTITDGSEAALAHLRAETCGQTGPSGLCRTTRDVRKGRHHILIVVKSQTELKFSPPVCKVVVGVGHVDEALDEVGALDEAEEHLEKQESEEIRKLVEKGGQGRVG